MFAKFPNLPGTDRTGSPEAKDAAGHGARALDWHSLRARLSAESDLRGTLRGETEAVASWLRAEGSFDPRAAEALCGQHHVHPASAENGGFVQGGVEKSDSGCARLPDPKPSQPMNEHGCSLPVDGGGLASGSSVED